MRKLYEIFKVLKVHKRIVSSETIRGNRVSKRLALLAEWTKAANFSRNVFTGPRFKFVTYNYSEKFKIVAF